MGKQTADGKVYIVGAGPGDPGLLTLRGRDCLQLADAVLYDGLANSKMLAWTRPDALRICVNKHGDGRVWKQAQIDDKLVELARQGLRVVRLKGGDPSIFGRTSEELDRLVRENIAFEVIPGITAAQVASTHTGIPLTHRDWASAVAFVTGQQQSDGGLEAEEPIDWDALARFPGTLVIYMGVTTMAHWSHALIRAGKSPSTAAALVRRASWPDQEVLRCELKDLATLIQQRPKFRPPVIAIVGRVAAEGERFDWFTHRPLFGCNILVCRPEHQSVDLMSQLEFSGATVCCQPALRVEPLEDYADLDDHLQNLTHWDWLVFSSQNGVEQFFNRLYALQRDARTLGKMRIAAVGPQTAEALSHWRLRCDAVPQSDYGAESLSSLLMEQVKGQRVLCIGTHRSKDILMQRLNGIASEIKMLPVYRSTPIVEAEPAHLDCMKRGGFDYTVVTSNAAADGLVSMFGSILAKTSIVALSPITARHLKSLGYDASVVASEATDEGIIAALQSAWRSTATTKDK